MGLKNSENNLTLTKSNSIWQNKILKNKNNSIHGFSSSMNTITVLSYIMTNVTEKYAFQQKTKRKIDI